MTRKTITVLIEVEERAGDNAVDWAKDLLRESGYLDESTLLGAWWGLSMSGRTWLDAATKAGLIPADLSAEIDRAGDLLMTAWAVIANAHLEPLEVLARRADRPDRREWAHAALRFRDGFHAWMADHPGPAEEPLAPCGAVSSAGTVCTLEGSAAHDEHEGLFPAVVEVGDGVAGEVRLKALNLVERWR